MRWSNFEISSCCFIPFVVTLLPLIQRKICFLYTCETTGNLGLIMPWLSKKVDIEKRLPYRCPLLLFFGVKIKFVFLNNNLSFKNISISSLLSFFHLLPPSSTLFFPTDTRFTAVNGIHLIDSTVCQNRTSSTIKGEVTRKTFISCLFFSRFLSHERETQGPFVYMLSNST